MRANSKDSSTLLQLWISENENSLSANARAYHPAVLVECKLSFRSLRASFHYNEERNYTAWYPENDLPVDWDRPAIKLAPGTKLANAAPRQLPQKPGKYKFTPER